MTSTALALHVARLLASCPACCFHLKLQSCQCHSPWERWQIASAVSWRADSKITESLVGKGNEQKKKLQVDQRPINSLSTIFQWSCYRICTYCAEARIAHTGKKLSVYMRARVCVYESMRQMLFIYFPDLASISETTAKAGMLSELANLDKGKPNQKTLLFLQRNILESACVCMCLVRVVLIARPV